MKNPMLNQIALGEVSGPINDLIAKLSGSRARFWLSAFKRFLRRENPWLANPFEQTVEEQLAALRRQNKLGNWGITDKVFTHLAETAPAWPEGRDAYRSFRIRFGKGHKGVIQTFEAHAEAIKRVHTKFWRGVFFISGERPYQGEDVARLRLFNRSFTHHAVVEWVIIHDLQEHRQRDSITSVRGPKSLADEGLVLAWLVPDRVQAIDDNEWCAWFCAGYEIDVPESDGESWQFAVTVRYGLDRGLVCLDADPSTDSHFDCSVPSVE